MNGGIFRHMQKDMHVKGRKVDSKGFLSSQCFLHA